MSCVWNAPVTSVMIMTGLPSATLRARRSTSASSSPGATGITWHSPPAFCAASATSALCSGFRRADRLKRPAMRARSFIASTLAIHSPLSDALQQQSLLLLRGEQALLPEKPGGLSDGWTAGSVFVCDSTYFRLLSSPIINTAIEMP